MDDSEESLIRTYASLADEDLRQIMGNAQDFWRWNLAREELDKRRRDRNEAAMVAMTRQVTILTWVLGGFTACNLALISFQAFTR